MATQEERVRRNELLRESLTLYEQEECEVACAKYLMDFEGISDEQAARMESAGMLDDRRRPRLMRERHVAYLMKGLGGPRRVLRRVGRVAAVALLLDFTRHGPARRAAGGEDRRLRRDAGQVPEPDGRLRRRAAAARALRADLRGVARDRRARHAARAYESVDRKGLYAFLLSMKDPSGGFRMHDDGEVDVRGTYTALAVAALFNVLTPELAEGAAAYALRCQTYEGGFGGEPGVEAHGGYVFCALAALVILNATDAVDLDALERWLARRQTRVEGGFQGRTNKLVDGCYSFWQGGTLALVAHVRRGHTRSDEAPPGLVWRPGGRAPPPAPPPPADDLDLDLDLDLDGCRGPTLGDERALQRYILLCAQVYPEGGLRDKPGKNRDYYHTCYCLSGLAASQRLYGDDASTVVYGDPGNLLHETHPVFNVRVDKVARAAAFFAGLPHTHAELTSA
ncbi:prenyltransferase [Aureococcus anophagefferens]|nr:prenyltransferase [Aureococcus anophagefferens]